MNARQRDARLKYADSLRGRALHDLARLRDALALIADMADAPATSLTLTKIGRIARCALVGSAPPDAWDAPAADDP